MQGRHALKAIQIGRTTNPITHDKDHQLIQKKQALEIEMKFDVIWFAV